MKPFFTTRDFRQRALSALVLGPLVLLLVFQGGWLFAAGLGLFLTLGMREWFRIVAPDAGREIRGAAYASLLVTLAVGAFVSPEGGAFAGLSAAVILFFVARNIWVMAGIPYLAGSGLAMLDLREMGASGLVLTFYLLFVVWATDVGAYFAGRLIGGPKLAPRISPQKTWAGLIGGMALAAIIGYAAAVCFEVTSPLAQGAMAVVLAVVAQGGDLFESWIKRRGGVKDSGSLIPGHGGVLDRIDGLLFASTFFALSMRVVEL